MQKPFRYYGGKGYLTSELLKLMPRHETYVEVFSGSAALFYAKSPSTSKLEVLNDLESDLVNFYRVIRDEKTSKTLIEKIELTPYSREEYDYSNKILHSIPPNSVERAYRWFIIAYMSMSGIIGSGWSHNVIPAGALSKAWPEMPENLQKVHYRLRKVQVEHQDFRKLIPIYDRKTTFMYMDPPYVSETRIAKKVYNKEMIKDDHEKLVDLILKSESKFLLSGYDHPIYDPLVKNGWHRYDIEISCGVSGKKRTTRTEVLWFNFIPKKEDRTFRMEGLVVPDQEGKKLKGMGNEEKTLIIRMEEERPEVMAQELLSRILRFRLPEWREFLMSRTKNH